MTEKIYQFENGKLINVIDNRTIDSTISRQIQLLKQLCSEEIDSKVSKYDQINAALGILSEEETIRIKTVIESSRQKYQLLKTQILNIASSDDIVPNICDQIEKIIW